jgi:hypothetical protein
MEKEIIASNLTLAYMVKQLANATNNVHSNTDEPEKLVKAKYLEFLDWVEHPGPEKP